MDNTSADDRGRTARATTPDRLTDQLQRFCAEAVTVLDASGVGLSVMTTDGHHGIAAASDPATARIEELQFTFGEGPCIDAFAASRPVLISALDDATARRWPAYAPAVVAAGVRAVFAFPLQVGAARLGVLDVFRSRPGPLTRVELGQAFTYADRAVMTLLDGQERTQTAPQAAAGELGGVDLLGELSDAFENGSVLFQAQGMIMVQLGISLAEAMVRIRARAYADGTPLHKVAADIVERRLRFDRDDA